MTAASLPLGSIGVIAVVAVMSSLAVAGLHQTFNAGRPREDRRLAPAALAGALVVAWLTLTGLLAARGFFTDFASVPPPFLLVILPPILAVNAISYLVGGGRPLAWLLAIPPGRLLWAQSFRIGVEAVLWLLYAGGAMASLMTFEGANFDILAGLSAPLAAWASRRGYIKTVIAWNIVGLSLLIIVLLLGILSSPTPIQLFFTDPPNTTLLTFPFVWIPGFLLPLGATLHVLSIRQQLMIARRHRSDTAASPGLFQA